MVDIGLEKLAFMALACLPDFEQIHMGCTSVITTVIGSSH